MAMLYLIPHTFFLWIIHSPDLFVSFCILTIIVSVRLNDIYFLVFHLLQIVRPDTKVICVDEDLQPYLVGTQYLLDWVSVVLPSSISYSYVKNLPSTNNFIRINILLMFAFHILLSIAYHNASNIINIQ